MLKKSVSVVLSIAIVLNVYGVRNVELNTVTNNQKYSVSTFWSKVKDRMNRFAKEETTEVIQMESSKELVTEEETEYITEQATEKPTEQAQEVSTQESAEQSQEKITQVATEQAQEKVTQEVTEIVQEKVTEVVIEKVTVVAPTQETTVAVEEKEKVEENEEKVKYYEMLAKQEAEWLWEQQLSNGAFAFYNEKSGNVHINPYFSEIVAIALINYDDSLEAGAKIRKYFDWHFAHINTAESDYNGLEGTIYDYDVVISDGIVVSEKSRGTYDSTDSYSALYIKALADYARVYGDTGYLLEHSQEIKSITNVMFATMSGGYTYARPDYAIRYLMDNAEVYAGLVAAEYIYSNVIEDEMMLEKVSMAVKFYKENFNKDWWKGDHYATVLNPDNSEYTGYAFSWNMFYPCATAQMFPILYGIIDGESSYAKDVYKGLCAAWNWQEMDYISKGESVFCWGNFAYLGALMEDEVRLSSYMNKYGKIVDAGRLYPLYSAESAMVLMGCEEMLKKIKNN